MAKKLSVTDGKTDGHTDRQTDRQTDRRTDRVGHMESRARDLNGYTYAYQALSQSYVTYQSFTASK